MIEEPISYEARIGSRWISSGRDRVRSTNPATGEVVGEGPVSTAADVSSAVEAAREAFDRWRKVPAPTRAEMVEQATLLLEERRDFFAELVTREMGKTLPEAIGDVKEAIDGGRDAMQSHHLYGETKPSKMHDKLALTFREPMGVIGAITPWNFPIGMVALRVFPALAAGDAVIVKPSPHTPATAYEFVRLLIEDVGFPSGTVNLVFGDASIGESLVCHPGVDAISFTGSSHVGRRIGVLAAERFKPVSLECGGKNAIIVLDDADLDLAANSVTWTAFATSGQRCSSCSRVIVQDGVADEFAEKISEMASALRVGNGMDPQTDLGPLIDHSAVERCADHIADARDAGAKVLTGGSALTQDEHSHGHFFSPTVVDNVAPGARLAQEEIFGPVLSVIRVGGLREGVDAEAATNYGLVSSIFTRDLNAALTAAREASSGVVQVNYGTAGAEVHMPFAGTGMSGNGVENIYTRLKSVYIDYSGRLQRVHVDDALEGRSAAVAS